MTIPRRGPWRPQGRRARQPGAADRRVERRTASVGRWSRGSATGQSSATTSACRASPARTASTSTLGQTAGDGRTDGLDVVAIDAGAGVQRRPSSKPSPPVRPQPGDRGLGDVAGVRRPRTSARARPRTSSARRWPRRRDRIEREGRGDERADVARDDPASRPPCRADRRVRRRRRRWAGRRAPRSAPATASAIRRRRADDRGARGSRRGRPSHRPRRPRPARAIGNARAPGRS